MGLASILLGRVHSGEKQSTPIRSRNCFDRAWPLLAETPKKAKISGLLQWGVCVLSNRKLAVPMACTAAAAQVGEISKALNAGRHTTTSTSWYWLDETRHSALIDSPGFQEFGLRQLQATDLVGLMPDLRAHADACRFYNCSHLHEPGCGVRAAVDAGAIHPSRYRIYGELRAELSQTRY